VWKDDNFSLSSAPKAVTVFDKPGSLLIVENLLNMLYVDNLYESKTKFHLPGYTGHVPNKKNAVGVTFQTAAFLSAANIPIRSARNEDSEF
jgi:hypothetical protein